MLGDPYKKNMKTTLKSNTISTGLAMFSMFFGAGNVVFPLILGVLTKEHSFFAVLGFILTAVAVPFTGLIAMILFEGNYKVFLGRLGKIPSFFLALFIMCLIGPFGGIPRCIALSYSTITMFTPSISLEVFSIISCIIIFLFTFKENSVLDILGYFLTPFLLISLGIITLVGLFSYSSTHISGTERGFSFVLGLKEGYHTMDLLAAFFFSSIVINCLQKEWNPQNKNDCKNIVIIALKASAIGAFLLAIIYIGFSYIAALHSDELQGITTDLILAELSLHLLGPYGGIVASLAVALACLTTAIALASAFSRFLEIDIFQDKVNYTFCLLITLFISFLISTLNFNGIVTFLSPILSLCYPSLITLSVLNLAYKLFDFKPVKTPVFIAFILTLFFHFR